MAISSTFSIHIAHAVKYRNLFEICVISDNDSDLLFVMQQTYRFQCQGAQVRGWKPFL